MCDHDLERLPVVEGLERGILAGCMLYMHCGIVCSSGGPASRFTQVQVLDFRASPAEVIWNLHGIHIARLCRALIKVGGLFSIENQMGSYVFLHPESVHSRTLTETGFVDFDEFAYGLQLSGGKPHHHVCKRTTVFESCRRLLYVHRMCPGICDTHKHEQCWGTRAINGKKISLTAAAHYPKCLCRMWAEARHECRQSLLR